MNGDKFIAIISDAASTGECCSIMLTFQWQFKWCAINVVRLIETEIQKQISDRLAVGVWFNCVLLTDLFFEKTFQAVFSLDISQILNVSWVQFLFLWSKHQTLYI